jgi:predicted transcriptional regulator
VSAMKDKMKKEWHIYKKEWSTKIKGRPIKLIYRKHCLANKPFTIQTEVLAQSIMCYKYLSALQVYNALL